MRRHKPRLSRVQAGVIGLVVILIAYFLIAALNNLRAG